MQRHLSLVSGSHADVLQRAIHHFQHSHRILWITQESVPLAEDAFSVCLPANKARSVLGREFFTVIFDVWSGLDVNALAAVSGTLCAGGSLVLLTPPLADWPQYADPDYKRFLPHPWRPDQLDGCFLRRFIRLLAGYPLLDLEAVPVVSDRVFNVQTSDDQLLALGVILDAREAVVMMAARGRGKSAVLGMVVECLRCGGVGEGGKPLPSPPLIKGGSLTRLRTEATDKRIVSSLDPHVLFCKRGLGRLGGVAFDLLPERELKVLLTAPSRAAAETVFKHTKFSPEFIAPDDLLQTLPEADVLLVDEAAMIPVPMLLAMQQHYPRCVFSTTSQGYEGSGRGFVLRFQAELDKHVPGWKSVRLNSPIRWAEGDQLEVLLNDLLLLDVELAGSERFDPSGDVSYRMISQQELLNNEVLLRQLFSLLVSAHYQTRPSDLRQMLDAPQLTIHVLEQDQQPVAVALLTGEGGLDAELVAEIHAGKRRPHGHLLAQSLTFHAGIEGAACLYGERVMRIAVHPELQGQGLGSRLLDHVIEYSHQHQADYVGVSYAVSDELLAFWQRAGFVSVRLGFRKDKASGARSLMQVLGLSDAGISLSRHAMESFQQSSDDLT